MKFHDEISEMTEKETRKQLAKLRFTEKVKLLEKLRDRSLAIAASRKPKKEIE